MPTTISIKKFAGPLAQGVLDPEHEVKECLVFSKEVVPPLSPTEDLRGCNVPGQTLSSLHWRSEKAL